MIRNTFCHLQGIGEATERKLWESGLLCWDDVGAECELPPRLRRLGDWLLASHEALLDRDWAHFQRVRGGKHSWRWLESLRERAVYLDIETTGGAAGYDAVTVIACYDGREARCFVRDVDLGEFPLYVSEFDLIVTYNGGTFDLPYLAAQFPQLRLPPVHLDLRYPLANLGYKGGLKSIEQQTGLCREDDLCGVDGWTAVLLWDRHLRGDRRALPTLLRYAVEDVLALEPLAELAYNESADRLPLPVPLLGPTPRRRIDLPYSLELITELGQGFGVPS